MFIKKLLIKIAYVCMVLVWLEGCQGCHRVVISPSERSQIPDRGGIPNLGNTCYMNAVLQIIAKFYPDMFASHNSDLAKAGQVIVNKIKDDQAYVTKEEAKAFYTPLLQVCNTFNEGAQEDAQEFIIQMYNIFNIKAPNNYWEQITSLDRSQEYSAWREAASTFLNPPLLDGDGTMKQCLEEEVRSAELIGDNQYEHTSEQRKVDARRSYALAINDHASPLPIFLKKFNAAGNKRNNNIQNVFHLTIPSDIQYPPNSVGKDLHYTLQGFVHHIGSSPHSGHYVAYIHQSGEWKCYDDETVTNITLEQAEEYAEQAYLFFYETNA